MKIKIKAIIKKTNIHLTGQSIDKKVNPSKKVSDFY